MEISGSGGSWPRPTLGLGAALEVTVKVQGRVQLKANRGELNG